MNVIRNDWWVTPVWEIQTDFDKNFNDILLSEMKSFYSNKMGNKQEPNIWSSNTPYLKELNNYIIKTVTELTHDYVAHNYDEYSWHHTKGWGNYNLPGQSMPLHGHGSSKITSTYYIQAEDNCGDMLLVDPRGGVDWDKQMDGNVNGTMYKRVVPKSGKLVFFPAFVLHSVDVNKSKDIRISLSTNMQTYSTSLVKQFVETFKD